MEEIQEQNEVLEPEASVSDNPELQAENEGQAQAPSELILGKFKSVDDLSKAYQELEKHKGLQSQELGTLRQNAAMLKNITQAWDKEKEVREAQAELMGAANKYKDYFQDPSFKQIYKEAYLALGNNLDADKFINLLEGYVSSRIFAHERKMAANSETQKVLDGMNFSKNTQTSFNPPKKRLDEMTSKEVDELLERLI